MTFEDDIEKGKPTKQSVKQNLLSFDQAIEMGIYDPFELANYPKWHQMNSHVQFQFVRKALDNKRRQLMVQWSEISKYFGFF
jgi:hypothetical protein